MDTLAYVNNSTQKPIERKHMWSYGISFERPPGKSSSTPSILSLSLGSTLTAKRRSKQSQVRRRKMDDNRQDAYKWHSGSSFV